VCVLKARVGMRVGVEEEMGFATSAKSYETNDQNMSGSIYLEMLKSFGNITLPLASSTVRTVVRHCRCKVL
jgi:hypothetical protein